MEPEKKREPVQLSSTAAEIVSCCCASSAAAIMHLPDAILQLQHPVGTSLHKLCVKCAMLFVIPFVYEHTSAAVVSNPI